MNPSCSDHVNCSVAPPPGETRNLNFKPIFQDKLILARRTDDVLARQDRRDWTIFRGRTLDAPEASRPIGLVTSPTRSMLGPAEPRLD